MTAQARLLGGRYQVGELLGYGGMAEVHRGRDLRLGRDVAIKMLRTDLARDHTFQERFRREAQNAAALNHPAIVAVYDTGEERAATGEALPFIVMEFVNGRTLKEELGAEGRLTTRRALEISADICAALEFSHRHGIIHRDIKPGNVMLNQNNQVKVMDFGIARALASGATTMTQTSAVIGTAQYLSPEQARGEAVDARSDVYAAGCVLFELLCGHPPFVGDSPVSVAYQHVREDPRAPSTINHDVGPDIDAVVLKALAKNPLNRYQSAAEMRSDLLRAANGRAVMATPVMSEDETMAMAAAPTRQMGGGPATRPVARVGDEQRRRTSAWVLAVLSALGVLAVVAVTAGVLMSRGDKDDPVTIPVPTLVGMTEDDARAELNRLELTVTNSPPDKSDGCKEGTVTAQQPAVGASPLKKGDTVTITVCTGPETVKVPTNLKGSTEELVVDRLKEIKLKPVIVRVNSEQREGMVVGVEREGEEVKIGTEITVQVSRGNRVEVPNVVNLSESDAKAQLRNKGFEVKVLPGDPSDTPGIVVDQNPNGGTSQPTGSTITIVVSTEEEEEPDPTGPPSPSGEPSPTGSPIP